MLEFVTKVFSNDIGARRGKILKTRKMTSPQPQFRHIRNLQSNPSAIYNNSESRLIFSGKPGRVASANQQPTTASMQKQVDYKIFVKYLVSGFVLVLGITLVLMWWEDVVSLFKGMIGVGCALAGMFMLYLLNKK